MKIHIDAHSGMAGNMFLAACLDLGLEEPDVVAALTTLPFLPKWSMHTRRERRGGMMGLHVDVIFPPEKQHRHLADILSIIAQSMLPEPVKSDASAMFTILAKAEAEAHGVEMDHVHFHEVGAVDAIVDICGAAYAAWRLDFSEVTAGAIPVGTGMVTCEHGRMSVPVPAVVNIFRDYRIPIMPDPVAMELVTPTGAAIMAHMVDRFDGSTLTRIDGVGIGLGSRDLPERVNGVRLLCQRDNPGARHGIHREKVVVLSCHIDDMNPEWYSPLWGVLFGGGALDVVLLPMTMKKGRPGICLEVIAPLGKEEELMLLMLKHTTTLGVRAAVMDRWCLAREEKQLQSPWGAVRIKMAGGRIKIAADDLAELADRQGWSVPDAYFRLASWLADNNK